MSDTNTYGKKDKMAEVQEEIDKTKKTVEQGIRYE